MFPRPTVYRSTTSTSTSSSFTGLSLFDTTQRAQMGNDLLYLFGSSSGSGSGSGQSTTSRPSIKTTPVPAQTVYSEKQAETEEMFITWPDTHLLPGSRSDSPDGYGSESSLSGSSAISLSLPDYSSPNSSEGECGQKRSRRTGRIFRRAQSEPVPTTRALSERGIPLSRARTGSEASLTSCTTTLVDYPLYPEVDHPLFDLSPLQKKNKSTSTSNSSSSGVPELRISIEVEEVISVSSQAKWELDLDLPCRSTTAAGAGGLRKNGPGGRGDRWNGNWV